MPGSDPEAISTALMFLSQLANTLAAACRVQLLGFNFRTGGSHLIPTQNNFASHSNHATTSGKQYLVITQQVTCVRHSFW